MWKVRGRQWKVKEGRWTVKEGRWKVRGRGQWKGKDRQCEDKEMHELQS